MAYLWASDLRPREDTDYSLDNPPADQYRTRYWTGATLINDWLYIDGGDVCSTLIDSEPCVLYSTIRRMNSTLAMPMNKSWTNNNITWTATPRPDEVPNMLGSRLPTNSDDSGFYSLGGWQSAVTTSAVPSNDDMWKFVINEDDPSTGEWKIEELASGSTPYLRRTNENSIVRSKKKIFDLGGSVGSLSDPHGSNLWQPSPLLRIFDLEEKKWSTQSTPWGSSAITNAAATYSEEWGDEGIMVVIGGQFVSDPYGDRVGRAESDAGFGQVRIFNPATNQWFVQAATGDIPSRRQGMCITSQYSIDGTLEVFMYGGLLQEDNGADTTLTADAFVLTIPGFQWFQIASTNSSAAAKARGMHTCVVAGNRNLVSVGGLEMLWDNFGVDAIPNGVDVLDMTTLEWTGQFNADADEYESSSIVKAWYSDDNLDDVPWSSNDMRALMLHEKTSNSTDSGSNSSSGTGNSGGGDSGSSGNGAQNTASQASGPLGTGAIIGIGIGAAIMAILFISFLVWCCRRRKISAPKISALFKSPHYELDGSATNSGQAPSGPWGPTPKGFGNRLPATPWTTGVFSNTSQSPNYFTPSPPAELMSPPFLPASDPSPLTSSSSYSHTPRYPPAAHTPLHGEKDAAAAAAYWDRKDQQGVAAPRREITPAPPYNVATPQPYGFVASHQSPNSPHRSPGSAGGMSELIGSLAPDASPNGNSPHGNSPRTTLATASDDAVAASISGQGTPSTARWTITSEDGGVVTTYAAGPVSPWDRNSTSQFHRLW